MTRKLVNEIEYDGVTNLPVITDTYGRVHILPWESINRDSLSERVYLQSWTNNYTWPSTTAYHPIPSSLNPGTMVSLTVGPKKNFNLSFIIAAQSKHGQPDKGNGLSLLGLYVNGTFRACVPFKNEIYYVLFSPISVGANNVLEFRYMPYDKKCDLGFIAGGPLIDCEDRCR